MVTFMRSILGTLSALVMALALVAGLTGTANAEQRPLIVELYTSQGCSSCPPADAYLDELAKRDDVIALTLPVDYWDYLGWKDTLASPFHTTRQRQYARQLGNRGIYTPQMVINGRMDEVGSRRNQVEQAMDNAKPADSVDIEVTNSPDGLNVTLVPAAHDAIDRGRVWLVQFDDRQVVKIGRGENSGRTVDYVNVVRKWNDLGDWTGEMKEITIPKDMLSKTADGCVIFVQDLDSGAILGAWIMPLPPVG